MKAIEEGQCFISLVMIRYETLRKNLTLTLYNSTRVNERFTRACEPFCSYLTLPFPHDKV